ncbi:deoxyribonuclease-4 [Sporomusaceae bacterium BoRhaA]|uniref:TIM barrel protein n=1 Tax=Pelorhabdus rhamnosifermentans TaxID=2772457 RepID=UPI0028A58DB5|nr:TIM barrel protein [Pelorhabdus rhamnosifermentans]MBU2703433.1 deoxyribonuclease-4 [Pelorhabdus rhamnosifermentans]
MTRLAIPRFGPAGNPEAFYDSGHKASAEMPFWLKNQGLTAYEYSVSRGVNIREATARKIGLAAKEAGISLSLHAPYYINLATEDEQIAQNTLRHIVKTLEAAEFMGGDRVVFHMGSPGKQSREQAMERVLKRFSVVLEEVERLGLSHIHLAPETMGKKNQLGTLEEVLAVCKLGRQCIPAVDFGHLHAVTCGDYLTKPEFQAVFDRIGETLGSEIAAAIHIHFSKIEFTMGGEKRHWTFDDPFGPPFEPLMEVIADGDLAPRVICESAGTQDKDAKAMQAYYTQYQMNKQA